VSFNKNHSSTERPIPEAELNAWLELVFWSQEVWATVDLKVLQ
jgi:hypothetical protein